MLSVLAHLEPQCPQEQSDTSLTQSTLHRFQDSQDDRMMHTIEKGSLLVLEMAQQVTVCPALPKDLCVHCGHLASGIWCKSMILALWRLRQEVLEFKVSLGYTTRPNLKTK